MQEYDYSNFVGRNIESKRKPGGKIIYVIIIFLLIIGWALASNLTKPNIINPVISSQSLPAEPLTVSQTKRIPLTQVRNKLNQQLAQAQGTYSIYFYDINTSDNLGINEQMVITGASVNKIPILAALYFLAGQGKIDLEKIIVPQKRDIQDYGTGSIRYDKPGTPYSIKTLGRLMMEKSDNTAAFLLASVIIGLDEIQNLVNLWGLIQTDMKENKTSARDMYLLMRKMYEGEITTSELTGEMLDFMDDSDFEDRIPAGIDPNVTVYHKTGDDVGKIHDVGIVDLAGRPYYLGIMTTDITNEAETKSEMAKISQILYRAVIEL